MTTCGSQEKVAPERGEDNRGFGNNLLVALTLALTARGQDIGNKVRQDMGNSFHFTFGPFVGRDLESSYSSGATAAVRKVGFEGPTKHVAVVSVVWDQPQVWLQMEAALRARRATRIVESDTPPPPLATANQPQVAEADSADAPAPPELGKPETAGALGAGIPRATNSDGAHDRALAQADETQPARVAAHSPRSCGEAGKPDCGEARQSGVDGGFQGLVSYPGRAAHRTADGAGPAQPLSAGYLLLARPEVGAGTTGLPAVVPTLRLPAGNPCGQWWAIRIHRSGGTLAFERVVDRLGDSGGIHCSWAPGTERWARTNAPGNETGNHATALAQSQSPATANESVGECLQWDSSSRRVGAANPGSSLQAWGPPPASGNLEVSAVLAGSSGTQQRGDQVAGPKAFCGRSLRGVPSGPEAVPGEMADLFWPSADWRTLARRCGRDAPGQTRTLQKVDSQFCSGAGVAPALRAVPLRGECWRTHPYAPPPAGHSSAESMNGRKCYPCPVSLCYPCVVPLPTLTLSPGRGNSVRPLVLGWILGNVRLLLPGRSETKQNARNLYGVGVAGRDLPLTGSSRARQRYQAAKER